MARRCGRDSLRRLRLRITTSTGSALPRERLRAQRRCGPRGLTAHCFAPTVLDLPDARYWGMLQTADLARLVHRDRPVAELVPLYRGWSLLPDPIAQGAEREPFAAVGWARCRYEVEVAEPIVLEPEAGGGWTSPGPIPRPGQEAGMMPKSVM